MWLPGLAGSTPCLEQQHGLPARGRRKPDPSVLAHAKLKGKVLAQRPNPGGDYARACVGCGSAKAVSGYCVRALGRVLFLDLKGDQRENRKPFWGDQM